MSDALLDALGDVFVSLNIQKFRKITFLQFVEAAKENPQMMQYIQIRKGVLDEFTNHQW